MVPRIFLNQFFTLPEQSWRRWIETVSCPAPQPENHSRDDDPGFHNDPETSIVFEEGVFYQESLDGSKVALLADHPGALPSSTVSDQRVSSRKGRRTTATWNTLTSTPKGRRTTRRTMARVVPAANSRVAAKRAVPTRATSSMPRQKR
jgi:hypothetical protein